MITFWERANIYNPALVRMVARQKNGKPYTWFEICKASTLTSVQVESITQSPDWEHVDINMMQEFLQACHMDFCNPTEMHRADNYLKTRPSFKHLRGSAEWRTYWLPMMMRWRRGYGSGPILEDWKPLRNLIERLTPILKGSSEYGLIKI